MEIDIDRGAIFSEDVETDEDGAIAGYRAEENVYLAPQPPLDAILTLSHEAGHIIGDMVSFTSYGLRKNVLSFKEIQKMHASIPVTAAERAFLRTFISSKQDYPINQTILSITDRLLKRITRGKYGIEVMKLHLFSQEALDKLVAEEGSSSTEVVNGKMYFTNSRDGRDSELSSIYMETAAAQVLETTLKDWGIFEEDNKIHFGVRTSPSHQRAQNIVGLAYYKKGPWRIPSTKDIYG